MFIDVEGNQIYAATGGRPYDPEKPVAIFLHGAGMDHSYWQLQSRWFAWHGYASLAVDLPGHGKSGGTPLTSIRDMAQWVGILMDAADLKSASLIGHSMGAVIALEATAMLQDRVDRLALLGISDSMPVHPSLLGAAEDNSVDAHQMMVVWGHGAGSKIGRNTVPGMWMTGGAMALLARNQPGVLHADLNACNEWKTGADAAEKITCPTLVVIGTEDMMTPAKKGKALAASLPDCQQVIIEDCGHMMMQEAPDAVLDALIGAFGSP